MIIEIMTTRIVNNEDFWKWSEAVMFNINKAAGEEILRRDDFKTLLKDREINFETRSETTRTKNRIRIIKK